MQTETATQTSGTEAVVRFDKVTKAFGDLVVLRELDLEVAPGEKIAIIGPSGSGKTTILRVLMTLEEPNAGVSTLMGSLFGMSTPMENWSKPTRSI